MFYEERVINGKLMYRARPGGEWTEYSYADLLTKYNQLKEQKFINNFKQGELLEKLEELEQLAMDVRHHELFN